VAVADAESCARRRPGLAGHVAEQRPGQVEPLAQAFGQGAAGIAGPADAAELTARK
jgi:hypothetical protein